jgi:hypothetical protein
MTRIWKVIRRMILYTLYTSQFVGALEPNVKRMVSSAVCSSSFGFHRRSVPASRFHFGGCSALRTGSTNRVPATDERAARAK